MNNSLSNQDCPPLMSDGRQFTDYRQNCYINDMIRKQNQISNNYDYKAFLTTNAIKLQNINHQFYDKKASCVSGGDYRLPDPNGNNQYWQQYSKEIGFSK